eukprot:2807622-Pleurochrysis_carterae.AAC.1
MPFRLARCCCAQVEAAAPDWLKRYLTAKRAVEAELRISPRCAETAARCARGVVEVRRRSRRDRDEIPMRL